MSQSLESQVNDLVEAMRIMDSVHGFAYGYLESVVQVFLDDDFDEDDLARHFKLIKQAVQVCNQGDKEYA